ncbi:response regulator transcription factor [Echinicola shivajiensis]|uniref:response regulator transcription factor n=1 Tax=Echinicola shivajiensis TaxID=1035916 RepID=UPI001BFC307D|nr:response regulator transcription factor [Echinicola shivajiensis]
MHRVLVIEDDWDIAELLTIHLKDLGCEVSHVDKGDLGFEMAQNHSYDLIVLDLMLPKMSGMDICQRLRDQHFSTPIMMLTAKSEEMDRVDGLEIGADVYMTKPFSILEFKASVKAVFRRMELAKKNASPIKSIVQRGSLKIDLDKKSVHVNDERISLTSKEFELLSLLASHPGKSFSRRRLLELVWDYDFQGFEHTVNSHINRLRSKIEADMQRPKYILTSWGIGYRFVE